VIGCVLPFVVAFAFIALMERSYFGAEPHAVGKCARKTDSPVEEDGFEPLVPREKGRRLLRSP
jgi:hypothetical protein